jgi:hypothetical protein
MSNLMVVRATWRIWSWNFIHNVNPSTPIPWNSSNYASILLIKCGFIVLYFYNHRNMFCHWVYVQLSGPTWTTLRNDQGTKIGQIIFLGPFLSFLS